MASHGVDFREDLFFPGGHGSHKILMKSIVKSNGSYIVREANPSIGVPDSHLSVSVHSVPLTELDVGTTFDASRFMKKLNVKGGLGTAFAGEVVAVGRGCSRFEAGEMVFGMVANPPGDSTLSARITVPESHCAKCPSQVTPAEAASLVVDLLIAERTLRSVKACDADSILITGGTTPTARALIELAKSSMFGVEWVASPVRGFADREYAESIGADETFDISCDGGNWSRVFESGINRKEYDIVIDLVGDSKHAKRLLKPVTGRLVSLYNKPTPEELLDFDKRVGGKFLSPFMKRMLENRLFKDVVAGCSGRRRKCKGSGYYSILPSGDGEILDRLSVLIDMGVLTPKIEETIPVEKVDEAVQSLRAKPFSLRGRIVVEF